MPGGPTALAQDLRRLPGHARREPAGAPGALPIRRLRAEGRGRRQRRDALLRRPARGPRPAATRSSSRRRRPPPPSSSRTSSPSHHANNGERVVVGQRLMQATPDIFLGWTRGPGGRDFYFRQLWDMKGSRRYRHAAAAGPRVLRRPLRAGARPAARAKRRRGGHLGLPRHERHLRRRHRRLGRGVRRPQRAGPQGLRRGHRMPDAVVDRPSGSSPPPTRPGAERAAQSSGFGCPWRSPILLHGPVDGRVERVLSRIHSSP